MRVTIHRTLKPHATYGEGKVLDNDVAIFEFKTLELPWKDNQRKISCIPAGDYMVEKMYPTKKRKYQYFHVTSVPGRDSILFHPGNYTHDILGCILPGEAFVDLDHDGIVDVTNTTLTLKMLTAILPDKFILTITQ
jgi:hypothetical protein